MAHDPKAPLDITDLPTAPRLAAARWRELWIDGDPTALSSPLVALIGTRDADPMGAALTRTLAAELARRGVRIVSGGALGIDAAAHRGALVAKGRTVVVLPSGLEHWYPRRHAQLYQQVIDHGGALVSQFPPETPPTQWTFPRRNELLAALADVVVVVQAPLASGALLAADEARRLGRRVMAVPAAPGDRRGAGCLQLLRAGALPCTTADDVFAALDAREGPLGAWASMRPSSVHRGPRAHASGGASAGDPAGATRAPTRAPARARVARARGPAQRELPMEQGLSAHESASLDGDERLVYESLSVVARHVDELTRLTGLTAASVQRALLTLVLSGLADDRGNGTFTRC